MSVKHFFITIRWPLLIEAIGGLLCILFSSRFLLFAVPSFAAFVGGGLVSQEKGGSHAHAIWVGPIIFLENAFLVGGYKVIFGDLPVVEEILKDPLRARAMLFGTFVFASLLLSPVAMLISFIGSWMGKRQGITPEVKVDP